MSGMDGIGGGGSGPKKVKKRQFWVGRRGMEKKEKPAEVAQELFPVSKFTPRPPLREKKIKKKITIDERYEMRQKRRAVIENFRKQFNGRRPKYVSVLPDEVEQAIKAEKEGEATKEDKPDKADKAEPKMSKEEKNEDDTVKPPYNMKVNFKKRQVEVRVYLHKVPEQHVHVDCTETRFKMNTNKWTTKYRLDVPYVDNTKVDPSKATAEINHSTLVVTIPTKAVSMQARQKQAKLTAAIREGKLIRFVQGRNTALIGVRRAQPKAKSGNKGIDYTVRASASQERRMNKKHKPFLEDKDKALAIIDKAAGKMEERMAEHQKMTSKVAQFIQAHNDLKKAKREKKKSAKELALQEAMEQKKKEQEKEWQAVPVPLAAKQTADTAAGKRRRVSFAANPEVSVFHGSKNEDSQTKKKAKKERITIQYE